MRKIFHIACSQNNKSFDSANSFYLIWVRSQQVIAVVTGHGIWKFNSKTLNMRKSLILLKQTLRAVVRKTKSGIMPFTEQPSVDTSLDNKEKKDKLAATELFSQFTANIIKEEKIFVR